MNKKEINEIKKNLTDERGFMSINRMVTAYVDAEKNIRYKHNEMYNTMEEETSQLILNNIKSCFKGNIGKSLLEYEFPIGSTQQSVLVNLLNSKFVEEDKIDKFIQHIVDTAEYVSTYAIFVAYCTYAVLNKDKSDESEYNYNFFVTAICPVSLRFDGLICNETPEIVKESNLTRVVEKPTDGFIFPTFSDRQPDINSVMYYTSKPKQPNTSIIEETLGCEFIMSAPLQKETFNDIITTSLGSELNYDVVTAINDMLSDKIVEDNLETEPSKVTSSDFSNILKDVGIKSDVIESATKVFEEKLDKKPLNTEALFDKKTTVISGPFTITFDKSYTDLLETKIVNGRKCITLTVDEPLNVNGVQVDK